MTIVFPMAGFSQRFLNEGFTLPKYMLYVGSKSIFNLTVSSFENYFDTVNFIFIARNIYDTKLFIENECKLMKIKNYRVIILDQPTKGQAETVYLGLHSAGISDNESIIIFNIDTIRKNYSLPLSLNDFDGYLEVFEGSGKNWSYAEPLDNKSTRVQRTAEKQEISNLCSTGLYYFKNKQYFCDAFNNNCNDLNNELFVAPLYNVLINEGKKIHYNLINRNEVVFTGVPNEYLDLVKSTMSVDNI